MNIWQNAVITNKGYQLLAKLIDGNTLNITKALTGSGYVTPGLLQSQTAVSSPKQNLSFHPISYPEKGKCVLPCFLDNQSLDTGYTAMQIGIYAQDPDVGEILFFIAQAESGTGTIVPSKNEMPGYTAEWSFTFAYGKASSVNITVDPSNTISQEVMENYVHQFIISVEAQQAVNGVCTLTHSKSGTVHNFTGMQGRSGLVPCQFKSTAGYTEGDTATIDGTAYTITLTGADAPETDLFVSGKSILVDVDTEGKLINFKSGGGLTNGKLALADATEDTVFNGRTFYAGDKTLRTGRALATPTTVTAQKMFKGIKAYNDKGQLVTGAPTATSATAGDIVAGKTAYDNEGNFIKGTRLAGIIQYGYFPKAGAGLVAPGDTGNHENTFTARWDSSLGYPKQFIAWFDVWAPIYVQDGEPQKFTNPSFSPYLNRGSITGTLGGTTTVSGTHQFRNQNQSFANSTVYVSSSYARFTVSYYDYVGNNDLCWIAIW